MTSSLARVAVSLLVALLMGSLLLYGYLAGIIGNSYSQIKWLLSVFFYLGISLCLAGVIFTLTQQKIWVGRAFISAAVIVMLFVIFLIFVQPTLQQRQKESLISNMQLMYQHNSLRRLNCPEGFQVHLIRVNQQPLSVVMFQQDNFLQYPQKLAGWDKTTSMNDCRFIENTYAIGTQRRFLEQCQNDQQISVTDLIAQARLSGCE